MSSTLGHARDTLTSAGYRTAIGPAQEATLYFEDATLMGSVFVMPNISVLRERWRQQERAFLDRNLNRLRVDPDKCWNIYCVFLVEECEASPETHAALLAIEEDFQHTRKIARGAHLFITTRYYRTPSPSANSASHRINAFRPRRRSS